MARSLTQEIQGTECIGDSLQTKINPSFLKLDEAVQSLSSTSLIPVNTSTIDLTFNTVNRQLNAVVKDSSITNVKLAFDGGSLGFRNKIINGNFNIWQRGTSFNSPAGESYTADRWKYTRYTTGTVTNISRQSFAIGQTDVPNNPKYFIRLTVSTTGDIGLAQNIEDVTTLAGKTVTYSFWAKASAPTTLDQVYLLQIFGVGGSPITISSASLNAPVTTSWSKITGTVTLPSVLGKTIGTDGNDCLQLRIDIDQTFTGTFDIAQVQLEEGPTATPFEQRPVGLELSLCQRYFQSYPGNITNAGYTTNGTAQVYTMLLPTPMRVSPTINFTPLNVVNATLAYFDDGGSNDRIFFGVFSTSPGGGVFQYTAQNATLNAEL